MRSKYELHNIENLRTETVIRERVTAGIYLHNIYMKPICLQENERNIFT